MTPDLYASLADLARGWRAQADDLFGQAVQQVDRAEQLEAVPSSSPFAPDPEWLRRDAQQNRAVAGALVGVASELDDAVELARRHVLRGVS